MKFNIDHIKSILNIMESNEHEDDISLRYIIDNFKIPTGIAHDSDIGIKIIRNHLSVLHRSGFIESSDSTLGISSGLNGDIILNSAVTFRFTLSGYQLLEALNNDTIKNKILSGAKEVGMSTLKSIPALAIEMLAAILATK